MDEICFDDILDAAFDSAFEEGVPDSARDDTHKELFRSHLLHEKTEDRLAATLMGTAISPAYN